VDNPAQRINPFQFRLIDIDRGFHTYQSTAHIPVCQYGYRPYGTSALTL
jgi:hypothetical protein